MSDRLVWYAAYGSNLSRDRFLLYLLGGRPGAGQQPHAGAGDRTPPRGEAVVRIPGVMGFAGASLRWSGGTSVLHHEAPGRSISRLWLLTAGQLADVAAQECGLEPGALGIDLEEVVGRRSVVVSPRRYGRMVHLGDRAGSPVVTMTSPRPAPPSAPGSAYLDVVRAGLEECGLGAAEIDAYLVRRPGFVDRGAGEGGR